MSKDLDNDRQPYELFRGVYSRVARQLGVDRSYVSRVAQGQRRSKKIEEALRAQRIEKALRQLGKGAPRALSEGKSSVLVVDDEQTIANTIAQILQDDGFQARVAYGGREAIREVLQDCPHTLLADIAMPYVNGIEAAKAIREMCPDTRILLFSGHSTTGDLLRTAEAQGYCFELLPKPISPGELLQRLGEPSPGLPAGLPS